MYNVLGSDISLKSEYQETEKKLHSLIQLMVTIYGKKQSKKRLVNYFSTRLFDIKGNNEKVPNVYERIPRFLVFDVKHDLKRKTRYVAGGHVANPPKEYIYSGVIDHESVRIGMILAEHNGLEVMATDLVMHIYMV